MEDLQSDDIDMKCPVFLLSQVAPYVYKNFSPMKAMDLDMRFGANNTNWIMHSYMNSIFGPFTWTEASRENSLGMIIYLHKNEITCGDFLPLLQFAVDNNQVQILYYLLQNMKSICNVHDKDPKMCPSLNKAFIHGFCKVINLVINKWGYDTKMINGNAEILIVSLLKKNNVKVIKYIIPKFLIFDPNKHTHVLSECIKQNNIDLWDYLYGTIKKQSHKIFLQNSLLYTCGQSKMDMVKHIYNMVVKNGIRVPTSVYQIAIQNNQSKTLQFLQDTENDFSPSNSDMKMICENGYFQILKIVGVKIHFRENHIEWAVKCQNKQILQYVLNRVKKPFNYTMACLEIACKYGSEQVILLYFEKGKFTTISTQCTKYLIDRNLFDLLSFFNKCNCFSINDTILEYTIRKVKPTILNLILSVHPQISLHQLKKCFEMLHHRPFLIMKEQKCYNILMTYKNKYFPDVEIAQNVETFKIIPKRKIQVTYEDLKKLKRACSEIKHYDNDH